MSIRVALRHTTRYDYDRRVRLGPQVVRLRPAPHSRTRISSYSFHVSPSGHFLNWQQDPQGNFLARLVFHDPTDHFEIGVEVTAELAAINPFEFFLDPGVERLPFEYGEPNRRELGPYLEPLTDSPRVDALVSELVRDGRRTIDFLVELNQSLQRRVRYVIRLEPGVQTPEQTLELGSGSCRDSAWLMVEVLRRCGFAARFVSGYLIQLKADQKPIDGPAGPEADFTDLHAWAEAYLPGAGWVGFDATSGLMAAEGHIPLASAPDPSGASPIEGGLDECEVRFSHAMSVVRLHETPRVTLPYTEPVWERISALGRRIDDDLRTRDVRLTMGGEPTFVSLDDPDGLEWNFTALGPAKRRLAGQLFRRLARRFATDPLLHYGQGKWYPGEPLPRWALGCFFRKDGGSIWRATDAIAEDDRDDGASAGSAERFIARLAERLEVDPSRAMPAYEDPFYYTLRERRLPVNVSTADNRLDDPLERERVARIFEQGVGSVVGYVIPIAPSEGGQWRSGSWFLRREMLYLLPGDSAMGFRLPLDSLPWQAEGDRSYVHERDPFAPVEPLPPYGHPAPRRADARGDATPWRDEAPERRPQPFESPSSLVRTALCVEPRGGILHVFLPPLEELEAYLDLVRRVEAVAVELGQPVRIEGYTPPSDPRIERFSVTPDPGVIEVNIHPLQSFADLEHVTSVLYEEARETRLGTEKFLLDGRHIGTGGGNHLTLGGPTAPDSPFLRRPDLLGSLSGYWHDHPALSYLFSGLFIGPTSQAPRADEGRHEASYELEVALAEARRAGARANVSPWLVDRIFRNLLADVTGNTHRAEFCIDKMYSPDSAAGRNGLLEMRAFEMPPHARMSLAQMLLVRALVSRFWDQPYRSKVTRWGTSLHDRFLLPHFVWQDFREVLGELSQAGYPLEAPWFLPHHEFRFPRLGSVAYDGVELELRRALEPWHVLAEEVTSAGTARSVDSSVERVQVMLRGATPGRHVVSVGGALVPLHPTGTQGEFVAGVRYRAWELGSQLHPTVGVHAPLELSLIDTWAERALGGCTVYAGHPGGRAYDRLPVNAFEAESRRGGLFVPFGHAQGRVDVSRLVDARSQDYPFTLDLRRLGVAETARKEVC